MLRSIALPASRSGLQQRTGAVNVAKQVNVATYKRTLVSTVLLSRDGYEGRKVAELKSELKQRGLSTNGRRQDLVKRLLDSDSRNAKVLPSSDGGSQQQQIRSASSQPSYSPSKQQKSGSSSSNGGPPSPSEGVAGGFSKPTISHPPNMEPGQVSSAAHDEVGGLMSKKEILEVPPTAPGVPPEKAAKVPITFEVKIPYEKVAEEKGPEIPLMTSYFHPESPMYKGPPRSEEGPLAHVPKVLTVSGEDTFPGGGVSHHVADFDASESGEEVTSSSSLPDQHSLSSAIGSMFSSMRRDLGLNVDAGTERRAKEATEKTVESTKVLLKDARDSLASRVGSGSGSASYSTTASYSGGTERPLNDDERRGLYVLAGIVGAGFLLGGVAKPSKKRTEKVKGEIQEKVQEAKGELPVLPDVELAALVARAESALKDGSNPFAVPGKGRAGKAFSDLK